MANTAAPATASNSSPELEALVALVARLSVTSSEATRLASEATRLATEVHAKLPLALAAHTANKIMWVRGTPRTPAEIAAAFPEGSGEVWYVVIRGREPGFYRTSMESNAQTNGVPNQLGEKKKTRRKALDFYRDHYVATAHYDALVAQAVQTTHPVLITAPAGVQKWIAIAPPLAPTSV
ncbi:hypothetical protein C8F04DRAFT_1270686 [Mycena alexandri]|uniref:Uncharacterized protein n=1 Tax=Mycena alexandri TaxID=1745969 RepID=A0AAD6SA85_9AGAR|nr:hypothetical protein C8F04DRAFT_1270686 [Mycena alexandri]